MQHGSTGAVQCNTSGEETTWWLQVNTIEKKPTARERELRRRDAELLRITGLLMPFHEATYYF
jgi:hypothetical protein